jgi:hypothetical protein
MEISKRQSHAFSVLLLSLALTAACTDKLVPQPKLNESPASAVTGVNVQTQVGVVPAGPSKESPATTSAVKSDVSKTDQSSAMPLPGQANDHSALVPPASKTAASPAR